MFNLFIYVTVYYRRQAQITFKDIYYISILLRLEVVSDLFKIRKIFV